MDEPEQTPTFLNTTDQDQTDGPGIDKVVVTNLSDGIDFPLEVIVYDATFSVIATVTCTGNGVFTMDLGSVDRNLLVFSAGFAGSIGPYPLMLPCSCPTGFECQLPIPSGKATATPVMNENRHIRVTITRIIGDPKPTLTSQEQKEMGE